MSERTMKGVLVAYSYSFISGSKKDKQITQEVCNSKGAGDDAGTWSNKLFPSKTCGAKNAFTDVRRHLSQMRVLHYSNTYVFEDELWRVLPEKRTEFYKKQVEEEGKKRAYELLDLFIAGLPDLIDLARLARGDAFKEEDYPTAAEVRKEFGYSVSYRPIPDGSGLNPALFQEAIQQLEVLHMQRLQEANLALINRMLEPFKTLSDQLANPTPGGRKIAPVLASIQELTAMVPSLEIAGNQELVALAQQMSQAFANVTPDLLRQDEEAARNTGKACNEAVAALERFGQMGQRAIG